MSTGEVVVKSENYSSSPVFGGEFLRNNWKVLLGNDCAEGLRFIKVSRGVASVTNGAVLLRAATPGLVDGFYVLDDSCGYRQLPPGSLGWLNYPDIDAVMPDFSKMVPTPKIPKEVVHELVVFCGIAIRHKNEDTYYSSDRHSIVMQGNGFCFSHDPNYSFAMPFNNLPLGVGVYLDPANLKIALTEMMRYDEIVVSRAERWNHSPIVFGRSWEACAIVKPMKDQGGYMPYRM